MSQKWCICPEGFQTGWLVGWLVGSTRDIAGARMLVPSHDRHKLIADSGPI
jgi:hypothetical protein